MGKLQRSIYKKIINEFKFKSRKKSLYIFRALSKQEKPFAKNNISELEKLSYYFNLIVVSSKG